MGVVCEGAERKVSVKERILDVLDAVKKPAILLVLIAAFLMVVAVVATVSEELNLRTPAYCLTEDNFTMVDDYLIAGVKSDNSIVAYLPTDPSAYYLVTLSTENWYALSNWSKVKAIIGGAEAKDYITIQDVELLTAPVTPVEVIEIQEGN